MAITAITGVMGSGKSYELVSQYIVKVLAENPGRRFVTNVEGLQYERIAEYCKLPLEDVKQRLVSVNYERVAQPGFWYDPEGGQSNSVVQPGDVVGLDEIWRYFGRGEKLPEDAMRFFRMHRHYADEKTGYTCDVVLVNQSFRGIHQDIRDVVEVQYACRKLKALGRADTYQVFVIEGGERNASHNIIRKYDKRVFPLYSSYNGQNAKEEVDKRQNVLQTGLFRFVIPLFLVLGTAGSWYTYKFLATGGGQAKEAPAAAKPAASAPAGQAAAVPPPLASGNEAKWRMAAIYHVNNTPVFVLTDGQGLYRTLAGVESRVVGFGEVQARLPEPTAGFVTPYSGEFNTKRSQ